VGCGREYDVTLFQFGRTIHCTCGRRVGLEPRALDTTGVPESRFAADAMLGRLAHWMRILGFDCAYAPHVPDAVLVRQSIEESRVILTRDRALPEEWRVPWVYVVDAGTTLDQLREVVRRFALAGSARPFTRCSRCNALLREAAPAEVGDRVPPRIRATRERFLVCPGCGRVYWEGSHTARMRRVLDQILGGDVP
jgi:uncharacterized protein with PIN domain